MSYTRDTVYHRACQVPLRHFLAVVTFSSVQGWLQRPHPIYPSSSNPLRRGTQKSRMSCNSPIIKTARDVVWNGTQILGGTTSAGTRGVSDVSLFSNYMA